MDKITELQNQIASLERKIMVNDLCIILLGISAIIKNFIR